MKTIGTALHVRIYIGESDKWGHKPLYMAIIEMLKHEDCAGATVTRGLAGFGAASRIHAASIMRLSEDLPIVIDWVDLAERVERVMPKLVEMVAEGMITVQEVNVIAYQHRRLRELRAGAPVRDIMRREVRTVRRETPLAEAVELLLGKAYRALPVVDDQNRVVGILTEGDLLKRAGLLATTAQRELTESELAREVEGSAPQPANRRRRDDARPGDHRRRHADRRSRAPDDGARHQAAAGRRPGKTPGRHREPGRRAAARCRSRP